MRIFWSIFSCFALFLASCGDKDDRVYTVKPEKVNSLIKTGQSLIIGSIAGDSRVKAFVFDGSNLNVLVLSDIRKAENAPAQLFCVPMDPGSYKISSFWVEDGNSIAEIQDAGLEFEVDKGMLVYLGRFSFRNLSNSTIFQSKDCLVGDISQLKLSSNCSLSLNITNEVRTIK